MRAALLIVVFALADANAGCPAAPAPPPQTDAWALQLSDTAWATEVPGWVEAPAPLCWTLGRVRLVYDPTTNNDSAQTDMTPGPWIEGVDYPLGDPCPEAAQGNCYLSPNSPKDPPAGCESDFCVTP